MGAASVVKKSFVGETPEPVVEHVVLSRGLHCATRCAHAKSNQAVFVKFLNKFCVVHQAFMACVPSFSNIRLASHLVTMCLVGANFEQLSPTGISQSVNFHFPDLVLK